MSLDVTIVRQELVFTIVNSIDLWREMLENPRRKN